jgi:hypothetical protein
MAYRHYTQCYVHTPGDKPFNQADLVSYVLGNAGVGAVLAVLALLAGDYAVGFWIFAIQYAATIQSVAKQWLEHRLVCLTGNQCAIGAIELTPDEDNSGQLKSQTSDLGEFDNDQFFDLRLMPHRHNDAYRGPNCSYATLGTTPWQVQTTPGPGPSLDGLTETMEPANDVFMDNFQGSWFVKPSNSLLDLPYNPCDISDTALGSPQANEKPRTPYTCQLATSVQPAYVPASGTTLFTRTNLHCEAEGNFWAAMMATAGLQGLLTAAGATAGAAAGAAAGCAIGGIFGPLGCAIGAFIGALLGLGGGGAAGAYIGASAAFNSDPGDVNDANVGDTPLGTLADGDKVVVYGAHVYDGFHEGWHEFHPLMAIMRVPPPEVWTNIPGLNTEKPSFNPPYLEWDPNWSIAAQGTPPAGLTVADMQQGLASPAFAAMAQSVRGHWCPLLSNAFALTTIRDQALPANRWTIHPLVDGCQSPGNTPPR